jgi:hypothetical protein
MPAFSAREDEYKGHPVLEILADGQPWGSISPYDSHFRFGVSRGAMILTARDLIVTFWSTGGDLPERERKLVVTSPELSCRCDCTTHASFVAHGQTIWQPYMKLVCRPWDIGFGVQKAGALVSLEMRIRAFVHRNFATMASMDGTVKW